VSAGQQLEWFQEPTPGSTRAPAAPERCPNTWARDLARQLGRPVELTYGRAQRNVVVVKSHGPLLRVRLNEHFAAAPSEVAQALADWLQHGKRAPQAARTLDAFVEELSQRFERRPKRPPAIRAAGTHHQLQELADQVLAQHFPGELPGPKDELGPWPKRITWGRRSSRRPRRSLQLGSFDPELRVIRIHPVLDQAWVPPFFVRYVLFHELLHAALDQDRPQAKRERPHPPAFRIRESAYPDFERAQAWQKAQIQSLLRSASGSAPR